MQRPEERALGDVLIPEDNTPGGVSSTTEDSDGGGGRVGISVEPPGFLKRLFSVPRNVRRTAATGDVVVPVIGARDGWGGIRQARIGSYDICFCPTHACVQISPDQKTAGVVLECQILRCHHCCGWSTVAMLPRGRLVPTALRFFCHAFFVKGR